jgi:hypothetical protein
MWILPSKGRYSRLEKLLERMHQTHVSTPGTILLHCDDPTPYEDLTHKLPHGWSFYRIQEQTDSPGENIRIWMRDNFKPTDTWLGMLTDDCLPITDRWDQLLIEQVNGTNLISSNDLWQAPKRITGPCVFSGDLLRVVGFLFPPGFKWLFMDDVWDDIVRNCGNWIVMMNVECEHQHGHRSVDNQDDTFKLVESFFDHDAVEYFKWINSNEPFRTITGVRELIKGSLNEVI